MWVAAGAAVGVLALIAVTVTVRGAQPSADAPCRTTLIPAYLPPEDLVRLAERPLPGRVVIVNPMSGPGAAAQAGYRQAVAALKRSGARVLGYVHTGYGERPAGAVEADIERYRAWYGVDGIFLDEAAHTDAALGHYGAVAARVRASGMRIVALNPGVVPARAYFGIADIVVTFEGAAADHAAAVRRMPAWLGDLPPDRIAHLIHGAPAEQMRGVLAQDPGAGYVYVTSGTMPDPWSALPDYLAEEEARLAACS
jgi:hypothetical protein